MAKQYRNRFKCRCMGNGNKHDGGVELMSGTWKVHRSLIQHIYPRGLHRVLYRWLPDKMDEFLSDDDDVFEACFEKVVYRYYRRF